MDARQIFQTVTLLDGLVGVGALTHTLPVDASLAWLGMTQGALTAACLCPRCGLVGPVLTRVDTPRPQVALTFDDGPDRKLTPWVLDILAQHRAKASFFCIGKKARLHPAHIRAIVEEGHSIENHSDRHSYRFALYGRHSQAREIDRAQASLADLSGQTPRFFRAPSGFRNPWLAPLLRARGLQYAAWSHRGFDTKNPAPDAILKRLTHKLTAGSILLLHDGRSALDASGRPVLFHVLPALLTHLTQLGLEAVSLPHLWDHRFRPSY